MKSSMLFCSALLLILVNHATALSKDDMDTYKTSINLYDPSFGSSSSRILLSHSGLYYTANRNKTLYVTATPGYSILVSIKFIDLRPKRQDSLKLFSVNGQVTPVTYTNSRNSRDKKYYRELETFYVPNGQLGITFSTGPYYFTNGYDGFELVYTSQSNWLQCRPQDFQCRNSRCIAKILKCDGHNHCGDESNLTDCSVFYPSPGRTAGIIFGVIFLLIAVACGVYAVIRRARNATTETRTVITSHPPPTTNLPSYPPSYPQPGVYPPPPPPYSAGLTNPTYH